MQTTPRIKGYRMGQPGKRDVKRTHSLLVDDLRLYQENHKTLKDINEMIVHESNDTGACYGVAKCAEVVFERRKMVRGEGLQVLNEKMKTIDSDENEIYKFLGVKQADGIKHKEVYNRVKEEISRRMNIITRTELNDKNLVKVINTKVIPVAACSMNVCKFTQSELTELDQVIKRDLRKNNMLGRQASGERLYMKRKDGGRGLKSLRDVYEETRLHVGYYMFVSDNRWTKEAWKQEARKDSNSIKDEIILTIETKGKTIQFEGEDMKLERKMLGRELKTIWKQVKQCFKKGSEEKRLEQYRKKEMQSEIYKKQDKKCNI